MKHSKEGNSCSNEISAAYEQFVAAAQKDKKLGLLFLIDPVQALSDAGIALSKAARKKFRRDFPQDVTKAIPLYNAVKANEGVHYIKCIEVALVEHRD